MLQWQNYGHRAIPCSVPYYDAVLRHAASNVVVNVGCRVNWAESLVWNCRTPWRTCWITWSVWRCVRTWTRWRLSIWPCASDLQSSVRRLTATSTFSRPTSLTSTLICSSICSISGQKREVRCACSSLLGLLWAFLREDPRSSVLSV